jgi:phenylacetic acid degradation operon negative regulatory protein
VGSPIVATLNGTTLNENTVSSVHDSRLVVTRSTYGCRPDLSAVHPGSAGEGWLVAQRTIRLAGTLMVLTGQRRVMAGGTAGGRSQASGARSGRAAAAVRPVLSRRREVSHTSARSLLMTLLGEFVLSRGQPVWTAVLVDALATFDVEEKSARQALARTAAEGWLVSERVGRRVRWSLTPPGRKLLTEGAERIYGFGRGECEWDGTWLVLLASVPESRRDLRHRLRTKLTWAGFGSPESGVWIAPDTSREAEAVRILTELNLADGAMSFTASYGAVGAEGSMVSRAWDLTDLAARYEKFIDEFTDLDPVSGDPVLHAQTRLVHEWRRFPFLDPQLPQALLPPAWSGAKAAELFHRKHLAWRPGAQQRWLERLLAEEAA